MLIICSMGIVTEQYGHCHRLVNGFGLLAVLVKKRLKFLDFILKALTLSKILPK